MSGRRVLIRASFACVLAVGFLTLSAARAGQRVPSCEDTWHWANPLPEGNYLRWVAYDGTTYVVTGPGGTVMTSSDGVRWAYQCLGAFEGFQGLAVGPGGFVSGTVWGGIWHSPDGSAWTKVEDDFFLYGVWAMTYANGRYVAVGGRGNVSTSADGIHWTPVISLSPTSAFTSVSFGGGAYVATGSDGSVWTSPDAAQWARQQAVLAPFALRVVYGGGRFLACGLGGHLWTSPDGTNWTAQASPTSEDIYAATWDGTRFVAVTVYGLVLTSGDGASWTSSVRVGGYSVTLGTEYVGGQYFVMGSVSLLTSPDLRTWHEFVTDATGQQGGGSLLNVQYGGVSPGRFAVVGSAGTTMTSPDGVHWTPHPSGVITGLWGLAWGNGLFVATGDSGTLLTSPDGEAWTPRTLTTVADLGCVTYAQSLWVAAGSGGTVLTSPDGLTWTPHAVQGSPWFTGIAYGQGRFVAVGLGGATYSSSDAASWSPAPYVTSENLYGLAYGNGVFVAVGGHGALLTSTDGQGWSQSPNLDTTLLFSVTFTGDRFLAASNDGPVFSSTDGLDWTQHLTQTPNSVVSVCEARGMTVAVGAANDIQWSACGLVLMAVTPSSAGTAGGTPVTLTGANFAEGAEVFFGDLPATGVQFVDSTVLGALTPAAGSGTVDVTVVNPDGSSATLPGGFRYTGTPVITGIQKLTAPLRLKVFGMGFQPGCTVWINGVPVLTVYKGPGVVVAKNVKALIHKGVTVQVTVTNPDGSASPPYPFTR